MKATIHIDGAARGNPGPAAYAFAIEIEGKPDIEEKARMGIATNNVAEYTALVEALKRAGDLGAKRLSIFSDSELLVKQMNGQYRVKHPDLRVLFDQAKQLARQFNSVAICHIPRSQNSRADGLCNDALDSPSVRSERSPRNEPSAQQVMVPEARKAGKSVPRNPGASADQARIVSSQAIACLERAAESWAKGTVANPSPAEVWEELWNILDDHGVVHPSLVS